MRVLCSFGWEEYIIVQKTHVRSVRPLLLLWGKTSVGLCNVSCLFGGEKYTVTNVGVLYCIALMKSLKQIPVKSAGVRSK